jgi:2-methylcitrate dehydratase
MDHDRPTTAIAEYVASVQASDLSAAAKNAVVRHHFDSIACALGGFSTEPCQIVRNVARTAISDAGCSVFGLDAKVAPEQAVFANATMVRELEFNDLAPGGAGHPSDFIMGIFAAAELIGASGSDLVRGILVGYEVFDGLATAYPLYGAGFDTTVLIGIAGAMGAGAILGLDREELANAVALALVPSIPLLVARNGVLSNWKGSAAAHAVMNGLFAARLAQAGLTGPQAPFEGVDGLHRQVPPTGDLAFGAKGGTYAVERCGIRHQPVCGATTSIVGPLGSIKGKFHPDDIAKVAIETHDMGWRYLGGGSGDRDVKWNPQHREDADHSFPYIVATCLLDGEVTPESYSDKRLVDPALHALMDLITVTRRDDFTSFDPVETEVKIELRNGERFDVMSNIPLGHPRNPISTEELSKKFRRSGAGVLSDEASSKLEGLLWNLEDLTDLDELTRCYRAI